VNGTFSADVRKTGLRVDVHDTPDGIGGIANHLVAKSFADGRMSAVAALSYNISTNALALVVY
jgi:hypothetical protein